MIGLREWLKGFTGNASATQMVGVLHNTIVPSSLSCKTVTDKHRMNARVGEYVQVSTEGHLIYLSVKTDEGMLYIRINEHLRVNTHG